MFNWFRGKNAEHDQIAARRAGFVLIGICVIALTLRLINIGAEPFWYDEVYSINAVSHFRSLPVSEMVRYVGEVNGTAPLYYLLLRSWVSLFGTGEAAARSLSVVFSLLTVALGYAFGRRVTGSRAVGLVSALVLAVLPMQVEYGQEARPYSALCLAAGVAMLSCWNMVETRRARHAAAYVAASLVGLYLHYSFAFVLVATSGWWLASALRSGADVRAPLLRTWFLSHAAVFAAFLPWLPFMLGKITLGQHELYGLPRDSFFGEQFGLYGMRTSNLFSMAFDQLVWLTKETYVARIQVLSIDLFKILFLVACIAVVARLAALGRSAVDHSARRAAFLCVMVFAPLLLFVMSPQSLNYSPIISRHVITVAVPLAVGMAYVCRLLGGRRGAALLALFIVTLVPCVVSIVGNDAKWDKDFKFKEAAETINEAYRPGDLVLMAYAAERARFAYFLRPEIQIASLLPVPYYGMDSWRDRTLEGFFEDESAYRVFGASREDVEAKLERLTRGSGASRVWLYRFTMDKKMNRTVGDWFDADGWRHGFRAISDMIPLDSYERR